MRQSPTSRTLQALKQAGHVAQVVEKWNAFARRRVDLFGCIDIVYLANGRIVGVQTCRGGDHAARRTKALAEPRLREWLANGGAFEIWSWSKRGDRGKVKTWTKRIEEVGGDQL